MMKIKNTSESLSGDFLSIKFRRGIFFSFEEFLHRFEGDEKLTTDFSYVIGATMPIGSHWEVRKTVLNDLTKSPEGILKGFNDSTRNYIHQVMKKDLCIHKFITEPSDAEITEVHGYCRRFCDVMKIPLINLNYLHALRKAKRLNISYVYDKENNILNGHGYRLSGHRPELVYSFRPVDLPSDKERAGLLSKANRYSHYCDMLHLKSAGYAIYDFGGVSDGLSDNIKWKNIDEFKLYFGGTVTPFYNSILYNTIKSKVYLKLRGKPF